MTHAAAGMSMGQCRECTEAGAEHNKSSEASHIKLTTKSLTLSLSLYTPPPVRREVAKANEFLILSKSEMHWQAAVRAAAASVGCDFWSETAAHSLSQLCAWHPKRDNRHTPKHSPVAYKKTEAETAMARGRGAWDVGCGGGCSTLLEIEVVWLGQFPLHICRRRKIYEHYYRKSKNRT